jgi:hypothetical protein
MVTLASRTNDTTVPSYIIGDDRVLLLGATALVTSKSQPGSFREVDAVNYLCSCPAFVGIPGKFEGRGACRHVSAVKAAQEIDREQAEPVDDRPVCPVCQKRRCVVLAGRLMKTCARCSVPIYREIQRDEQMAHGLGLPDREWEKAHGIALNN